MRPVPRARRSLHGAPPAYHPVIRDKANTPCHFFCLGRLGDRIYYESYHYDKTGHVAADTTLTIRFINSLGEWVIYADTTGTTPGAAKTPLGRVHRPTGRAMLRAGRSGNDPLPLSSSRLYIYSCNIYLWRVYRKTKNSPWLREFENRKIDEFSFFDFFRRPRILTRLTQRPLVQTHKYLSWRVKSFIIFRDL